MAGLTHAELLQTIARVRRAMPRNADVMAVCDAAERAEPREGKTKVNVPLAPPKFDKKIYQRELMRKRRAEGKA